MKRYFILIVSFFAITTFVSAQNDSISNSSWSFTLNGFVNLNAILDFNGLDNFDDFTTSEIPINPSPYEETFRFHMTARQSRLNFSTNYSSPWGNIYGFISGDFYSGNTGLTSFFRLREAYVKMNGLLFGQSSTTFGDPDIIPRTIDFEGPNSAPVLRNPMIRYTKSFAHGFMLRAAIEMRGTDIRSFPNADDPFVTVPTLVTSISKKGEWGVANISAAVDLTRYFDNDSIQHHEFGYGGSISAIIKTWGKNHFNLYVVGGNGIADFVMDLSGLNYNGVPNLGTNRLHMLQCYGGFVGYTQYWTTKVSSNFIFSYLALEKSSLLNDSDFNYSKYILGNLFYEPFPRILTGIEFIYGELYQQDNQNGDARRLQFIVQYNF